MLEKDFKAKTVKELRAMGFKVIQLIASAMTPLGQPDTIILKEGFWGMLEFKKSKNAKKRPGQDQWIKWAEENSYGRFIYPENHDEIIAELKELAK